MEKITKEIKISSLVKIKSIPELKEMIKDALAKNTTKLLEIILTGGTMLRGSDIHIEPGEKESKIRIRIDGILQDVITIEKNFYQALIPRIKLLSRIKLNIDDRPQDGRFSILFPQKDKEATIEIRTSTLPAEHGETVVLRILNPKSLVEIETLGLRKDLLEMFEKEIKKPNGMIIVTGPTGSGKTTTLYAFLKKVQKPEIKIITIEDPIEYHLEGISQTQVAPEKGYDFASGLKSIMRQDPDIILVGEIRDLETAQISLQAALTGHLVFTTLHTNDAAGTIARLANLGAEVTNIGPALNLAIAQRLVRKVCQECSELKKISLKDLNYLKKQLSGMPKTVIIPKLSPDLKIPEAKGCKICNFSGYRDRVGIFEAFLMDDEMEKTLLGSPSTAALRKTAMQKGMVLMRQDGLIKVLEGVTTIEEVERVAGE